jgi:hypothetical protein
MKFGVAERAMDDEEYPEYLVDKVSKVPFESLPKLKL